jgi:S1-C subfamily serine protease
VLIGAYDGDDILTSGSGFFIFPKLVVTAKHVVAHFLDRLHGISEPRGEVAVVSRIQVFQFLGNPATLATWDVTAGWCSYQTDIAFLAVAPSNNAATQYSNKRRLALSALPPEVGERIAAYGYPSSTGSLQMHDSSLRVTLNIAPHTSVGEVREVHINGRDSVMLPFPCFRTNARFDGGMSGGPVFNSKGQVCGMICAGVQGAPEPEHCTYAATLWPSFLTRIDFDGDGYTHNGPYRVSGMVEKGLISAAGWDVVKPMIEFINDDSGNPIPRLRASTGV